MTDLVPLPEHGRRYSTRRKVRLGDTRVDRRLRFDALARFVQDIATDDSDDVGLSDEPGGWVVRRIVVEPTRLPTLGEQLELTTFCGGTGPRWAERRTIVAGDRGARVDVATLWAHIDLETGAPKLLPARFEEVYGAAAGGRRVRARLEHPAPPLAPAARAWATRATDFDVFGHMNNAVYWVAVEEDLAPGGSPSVARAEMEFRGGVDPGDAVELVHAGDTPMRLWFTVRGAVRASAAVWTASGSARR